MMTRWTPVRVAIVDDNVLFSAIEDVTQGSADR